MNNSSFGTDYYLKIGQVIRDLRKKKGLTITQLSDGICSPSYITRIENGHRCPTSVILRQITNKLGVSPDFLFRAIESPYALEIQELLEKLFFFIARDDYYNINRLLKEEEKNLKPKILSDSSIHDFQIIKGLKTISEAMLERKYLWGLDELNKYTSLTYNKGYNPTDVEFAFMFHCGFFLLLDNQKERAYNYLKNMEKFIIDINYYHTFAIYPKYFVYLATACLEVESYGESFKYLQIAINYCKKNNIHCLLRELYYLKSEVFYHLKNKEESEFWLNESLSLHRMIKYSDTEYFETFYKDRLNALKN